jgi:hypothetical protein
MAIHTQLPIYKVAYDLLDASVDFVANMPRAFKPVIGGRVSQLCLDLVLLIYRANCAREKVPHIELILERTQELEMWFRLLSDKRFISKAQHAKAIALTTSIGKQATGWKKHHATPPAT